jgi:hypothetical protein
MTEEYGHISDAFDNLPEEELLMPEQERKALEALDKLYKENGDAMTRLAEDEYVEDPWNLQPRQPMIPVKKQNDS